MKKYIALLLFAVLAFSGYSQEEAKPEIKNVAMALKDNVIIISYDLLNCGDVALNVSAAIFTADGKSIDANSMVGAIGNNVPCGSGKKILWDYKKDNFDLTREIYAEIYAVPNSPGGKHVSHLTKGKCLLFSALYPGLGNYLITKKKAWLGMGLLAYGSVALSVACNNKAYNYYQDYQAERQNIGRRKNLYEKAYNNKIISDGLGVLAATVWITDMVLVLVNGKKLKQRNNSTVLLNNFSIGYSFNNMISQPVLTLKWTL